MNLLNKNILSLPLLLGTFFFTACSSHSTLISESNTHPYNHNYGVLQDPNVDIMLQEENKFIKQAEWEAQENNRQPQIVLKKGEFFEQDYQPQPEIISYKYPFDPKFYSYAEWRKIP